MDEGTRLEGGLTGKRLGNYQVHRRLGKGGMGEVYFAHDVPLDRPVALKVLRASWANDEQLVERFHREARAAARLNHANIVQVYTVGTEGGVPYFAMELVEGSSLEAILKAHGAMPWQRALNIVGQVASALDTAHAKGIIHRDIKPANILIDKQGRARVTDFGVAKVLTAHTQLTTDGTFIGTPQYMSPEQCGIGEVSPASDLFSLGATTYEMLAGTLPFDGETPATLIRKITQDNPPPLRDCAPGVPESVSVFVHRMLEKDVNKRYKTAGEVLDELAFIRSGTTLSKTVALAHSSQASKQTLPKRLSFRTTAAIAAGLCLLLFIGIALGTRAKRQETADPIMTGIEPSASQESDSDIPQGRKPPLPDASDLLARFDTNQNGQLEEPEVPLAARGFVMKADSDGDHILTKTELAESRQRLAAKFESNLDRTGPRTGPRKDLPAPEEVMLVLDKNLDGAITLDEVPPEWSNFFRMNNLNRDTKVTIQEIAENRARVLQRQSRKLPNR